MVRLVLFDIDGTLIEAGGAGSKAFGQTCAMEFKIPNGTAGLRFAGRTDPAIVREFFLKYQIPPTPENFQRFFDSYVFWLDHLLEKTKGRVLPGIRELVRELEQLPNPPLLGLLTGNIRLGAQIKLTHYRLWDHFQTGGFGDDAEDRDRIAACARERGSRLLKKELRGEEILVIGDTPMDIRCGKAIQAKVLALATGSYSLAQLEASQPDYLAKDLTEWSYEKYCGNGAFSKNL